MGSCPGTKFGGRVRSGIQPVADDMCVFILAFLTLSLSLARVRSLSLARSHPHSTASVERRGPSLLACI